MSRDTARIEMSLDPFVLNPVQNVERARKMCNSESQR